MHRPEYVVRIRAAVCILVGVYDGEIRGKSEHVYEGQDMII